MSRPAPLWPLLALCALTSCKDGGADDTGAQDTDGDGYPAAEDCDDGDANVFPGAEERCDGLDNNCDGAVDEGLGESGWLDADGDGFGDPGSPTSDCGDAAVVDNADDCNDTLAEVNPDAQELCNGLDNNCDGLVGDGAADALTWYRDADADGYGDVGATTRTCAAPSGYVDDDNDCDDSRDTVHPGAPELCDSLDNDCDSQVDEDAVEVLQWYVDSDGDGFGDSRRRVDACLAPDQHVDNGDDCDDLDATINPDATELAGDRVDSDCDGEELCYQDNDADGYGGASTTSTTDIGCTSRALSITSTDCDDGDPLVYPNADELCDDQDNDCDGATDWGLRVPTDYTTIQSAIDASLSGETVCVAAGTWYEQLDYGGRNITVLGVDGSSATVLDGNGVGPVVTFDNSESSAATLQGFEISNGEADYGAGVYISSASPTLRDLRLYDHSCYAADCFGTGLYVSGGDPLLEDITVAGNIASPTDNAWGAGIFLIQSAAVLDRVTVVNNAVDMPNGQYSWGAGISSSSSSLTADNVWVSGNSCTTSAQVIGCGLALHNAGSSSFTNLVVAGNTADSSTVYGNGVWVYSGAQLTLTNATITGNSSNGAVVYSSGVNSYSGSSVVMMNTTVTDNTGTGQVVEGSGVSVQARGSLTMTYCNVQGNTVDYFGLSDQTGSGSNISERPRYTDTSASDPQSWDLTLRASSALIDAGNPNVYDADSSRSDIGAYGGPGSASW